MDVNILTNSKQNRWLIVIISLGLFFLSLITPSITFQGDTRAFTGMNFLLAGWIGITKGVVGWYANILYIFELILLVKNRLNWCSLILLPVIVLISTTMMLYYPGFPRNEAGRDFIIEHLQLGFYLWALALIMPGIFSIIYYFRRSDEE